MSLPPVLSIRDLTIIVLSIFIFICILYIVRLKKMLTREIHKRIVPLLLLEIDRADMGFYLKNISPCSAKDIHIENLNVLLKYDFNKTLTLKFEDIEFINPNEKVELKFQIFDKSEKLGLGIEGKFISYLIRASFEMHIFYKNIENIKFQTVISKENDRFHIKETKTFS